MSLQVWLPLNGDLTNNGLSNVSVTCSGATVDNNGKIGKCYRFDGTDDVLTIGYGNGMSSDNFSMSIWVKPLASINDKILISFLNGSNQRLYIGGKNGTYNIAYGSKSWGRTSSAPATINVWCNLVVTVKDGVASLYCNGNFVESLSYSTPFNFASNIFVGGRSDGYYANILSNDVRVYDHCLSVKEIKEISKALVLHYKLSGSGGNNLVQDGFTEITCRSQSGDYPLKVIDTLKNNTQYTISFDAKSDNGLGTFYCSLSNGGTSQIYFATQIKPTTSYTHYEYTVTRATQTTNRVLFSAYYQWSNNANVTDTIHVKNIKLEEGSIATHWTPHPSDSLYNTLGYNIEYDCSGYRNNGMKSGTITWDYNAPRYITSYKFGASSFICAEDKCRPVDAITVSWWGYMSNWSSYNRAISCTEGGGWNFEPTGTPKKMSFPLYQNGVGYIRADDVTSLSNITTGWHHWVGTFQSGVIKLYMDGQEVSSSTSSNTTNGVSYNAKTGLFIGAEAGSSLTVPATAGTFNGGNISDVRIYATVLSDEDILELYHSSAFIDNKNNAYAFEYIEGD